MSVRSLTMSDNFLQRVLSSDAGVGALALRIPVGIIFAAHGAQKLVGWFCGYGRESMGRFFNSIGLGPG
jgi:putative oxidoreductase